MGRAHFCGTALVVLPLAAAAGACDDDRIAPASNTPDAQSAHADVVALVDPFVGTSSGGNTFPGAVVPWGMASPSPHNNRVTASGYVASGAPTFGIGNVHMSGVGCWDMGSVVLWPIVGEVTATDPDSNASPLRDEEAHPGYYGATLERYGIRIELTATERVAVHRYAFPKTAATASVLLEASRNLSAVHLGSVHVVSSSEIEGYNTSGEFCGTGDFTQTVYFVARFSRPADGVGTYAKGALSPSLDQAGDDAGAYLRFTNAGSEPLEVRVGLSYTSTENARQNLLAEAEKSTFERIRDEASAKWNRALSRIVVESRDTALTRIFYTALYHALLHPNLLSDVNGAHPTLGRKSTATNASRPSYTLYSLWDTYRTLHPLLSLVYPERQLDMVRSLADMAREGGFLPKWELARNETNVMVGDPATIVIADTYRRGLTDFDVRTAYDVAVHQATVPGPERPGLAALDRYGFIPMDDTGGDAVWGPVSTTLEYALADWNLGELAAALGDQSTSALLHARSKSYAHYFDSKTGFLRPRNRDGSWVAPFDPNAGSDAYVEGNAWQYTFFVPHDVSGLRDAFGSNQAFMDKLAQTFSLSEFTVNNEPDIAYPYLFTRIPGGASRTQELVRSILLGSFGLGPNGLPGNDDTGTLSAWFIFGALGFYPDLPGSPRYSIGSPLFDEVTVYLGDGGVYPGKTLVIEARDNARDHPYVQSVTWNGRAHSASELDHAEITRGGTLQFQMGAEASP